VHPGETVETIRAETGFDYDVPAHVHETTVPDASTRDLIRRVVREDIAESYPRFAAEYDG
jgi:glutaconate CoA-transferase subunit B